MSTESTNKIVVLGATGKVGSQLIQFLSDWNIPVKALSRDISKAKQLPGVEWQEGDMNDDKILQNILQGSKKLFLNSGIQPDMKELQCHIIDVAKESGIEYIINLSTPSAREHSKDPIGEWHWQIEEYLKGSGLKWNILQPQSFMQNWLGDFAESVRAERKIYSAAGDGKRAFIDTRDIGEVAAKLFMNSGNKINKIIPLSGPEVVSYNDVADALGNAIGKKVTYVSQTPEEAQKRYESKGTPEWAIKTFIAIAVNQKTGVAEQLISENVSEILGKPAKSIYVFARDYWLAFKE